ncbi:PREDICTED: serine/threonine kinase-like domain-containing protein STKLD1 [Chaetura pelagica]|uniref:serine/threonine kinase-like domain-containing protein STKLD1 n=1 Tax=Chaetura pelagica TaxID=8897 RepID=UPI000523159E|nr:PREDICTED: serine/threonine kinase-like domain-containing protein STKLD1 [Chaetura pelagica]
MEQYEVLEELQPGTLGTMLVAKLKAETEEEDMYMIKKVECIDEKQANEALKEAMELLKLNHPRICAYMELFMTWDNEISSLFLCLVMQHMGTGDLSSLIEEKRQKSEKINYMVMMRFLGQIVDALFYVHMQGIFHGNLKPSNILVIEEESFILSDFSTETLMKDKMKWKIRVEETDKSWMAPETLDFSFTEKSDIWSLGCILLDMATCFALNAEEITSLLQDIREDSSHLDEVETLMSNGDDISLPLFPILIMMLQIQPSMRPTAMDLIDVPLISECLSITGASSVNIKKTLSPQIMDLLLEGEYRIILVFMKVFWDVEEAQAKAIQKLASFLSDRSALLCLLAFTEFIVFAMKTHIDSLRIQVEACSLLLSILSQALEEDASVTLEENVASCLLEILRRHSENEELLSLICTLLMMISVSESAAETLRQVELIPDLLSVLRNFLHNEQICLSCCGVLWSLAASGNSENNVDKEVLASAVPVISAVLQEHLQNGTVAESACSALWGLSLQGCLTDNDYEPTTVLLLAALRMNPERRMVVKNSCLALASLLRLSEIPALKLLTDSKGSGINLIRDAYQLHFDDTRVVNCICVLMNEMVQYGEMFEIKLRFSSNTEIMTLVDATLLKLEEEKLCV